MQKFQRDKFIEIVSKNLEKNKDIFFLSADFGAPALDQLREKFKSNFIHLGISEQNMVDVSIGLALEGKTVINYAMAPFISLRCLEQLKTASLMHLPIITLVPGIGLGYADAGPTHYATEDAACLNSMIGSNVYTASDGLMSEYLAKKILKKPEFCFIRFERNAYEDIVQKISPSEIKKGFRVLSKKISSNQKKRTCIVSRGYLLSKIFKIYIKLNKKNNVEIIDLFKSKPITNEFKQYIKKFNCIKFVDEQIPVSSLGAQLALEVNQNNPKTKIINYCLPEKHIFENGGREKLLNLCGLSEKNLIKIINDD